MANTHINMMLAKDYVSEWTAADAFRELVANAIDADRNYTVDFFADNEVVIETATEPSLTELILLGAGSKSSSSDSIGQFGEGAKLAALVLTRGRHSLSIETTRGLLTFSLKTAKHLDRPTLHCIINARKKRESGCRISFKAAGIKKVYRERFLARSQRENFGPIEKAPGAKGCRIYCRGILVKTVKDKSLFDWNFGDIKLNRDRNVPDLWDVKYRLAKMLNLAIKAQGQEDDYSLAQSVIRHPDTLEAASWQTIYPCEESKQAMAKAFRNDFGPRAVLSSGNARQHNSQASAKGFDVVALPSDLANMIHDGGVERASDVCLKSDGLTQVSSEPHREALAELAKLLDVLGIASESFHIFESDGMHLGAYDRHGVWLSNELFAPGKRFERIRTMLHEVGHAKGGDDESVEFENSLDWIAGKLGEKLLDERACR